MTLRSSIDSGLALMERGVAAIRKSFATDFVRGLDVFDGPGGGNLNLGLRRPYVKSVWIQAAIGLVTQPIKAVDLKFYLGDEEYEDASLTQFWKQPAQNASYDEFIDATAGWLKLRGEFFWLLDDTWLTSRGSRSRFIVASPDRMREIIQGGELMGWSYTNIAGQTIPLLPEQVIHEKRWNPENPWRGLAEVESAMMAAETDYIAGRYARDTWANQGEGGEYISVKPGIALTDAQRDQITAALRAKRAAKLRGDFRPLFFNADIEVKSPEIVTPNEGFAQNRLQSRHEIFIAFGVPASMADVQASYSIGSASDYFRLIHGASIPSAKKIESAIDRVARLQSGKAVESEFDFDEHPVMQQVRVERVATAEKLWDMGMPMKEINAYLSLGMSEYPGWETGYLPFNVQPSGTPDAAPQPEPGSPIDSEVTDPVSLMIRALKEPARKSKALPAPRMIECGCGDDHAALAEAAIKDADSLWAAHWRARQPTIKLYQSKFTRVLMEARAEVLARINKAAKAKSADNEQPCLVTCPECGTEFDYNDQPENAMGSVLCPECQACIPQPAKKSLVTRAVSADFNFDLEDWEAGLILEMNKAGREALNTAGKQCFAELGRDDAWTMPPAKAIAYLKSRENFFMDLADSIHTQIMASLEEGLRSGDTMAELAGRIRAEFTGISSQRALRIASTETAAAYGAARQEAQQQAGIKWKSWLTSGQKNVRPTHRAAEGETVALAMPFTVGGASLMHPGDGSLGAPPQEIINCHCVSISKATGPEGEK